MKALRHEAPGPESTAAGWAINAPAVYAFKIFHGGSVGRLALARVLGGPIHENSDFKSSDDEHGRLGALFSVQGEKTPKISEASNGDVVAVAKVDGVKSGDWLGAGKLPPAIEVEFPSRNCALAIQPADRKDDVKLSGALPESLEEDPSLTLEQDEASHEMRLRGVNDEHLKTVARQAEAPLRRRGQPSCPVDRLSRIDPQAGHTARPPQEAVGRPRPIRRRDHRDPPAWRVATASSSRRRSTAGRSPNSGSRRLNKASRMRWPKARSASRSSMSP